MFENSSPEPLPPAEAGISNTVTNISGGVSIKAQGDVTVTGDVVQGGQHKQLRQVIGAHGGDDAYVDGSRRRQCYEQTEAG
jgi:hypothetical protein